MAKNKPQKGVAGQPAPPTRPAENYSTFNLCKLIKILNRKKLFALKWLQKIGMLNRETACDNCGRPMTLVHRQNCTGARADKYEWECSKCRMCTKSLRSGTVFQSSKLSLQKITILMYFWAHDFPSHVAQRELSITERTVNKWYLLCQEACMDALIRNTSKLGGEGRHLEVVEGKLGKRAMDSYRTPPEHPVIGVIDVDTGSCLLQVVIGNTKATLLTLLKERIANGSTLHSKCWRVRDCFSDDKFCKVVKNHKLTLSNEEKNTFQKLHDKVCKSGDKVGTSVSFDPILCATIYKNAMKHEEFFFVKFLGELGTLYRDGIRYEMMNQLDHSEPGPSTQQRPTVNTSENAEWTSTIGTPCHRCRSKQYSNSEVQATEEITVCVDVDEPRNVSVSKQNVRKSSNLSGGNSGASDDVIVLDDTRKAQNGITPERTVLPSGDVRRKRSSARDEVTEVERSDKRTNGGSSERTANSPSHIPGTDRAEVSEVVVLRKRVELPNGSAGEKVVEASRRPAEAESRTARGAVSPGGDRNPRDDSRAEVGAHVSGCDSVVDIGGREPDEVSTDVDAETDTQTEEVANVRRFAEIDISREERIDVDGNVDERETIEIGVEERNVRTCDREDVREDADVTCSGDLDSEMAPHGSHEVERNIIVYEERDCAEDDDVGPCTIITAVSSTTVECNMPEEHGGAVEMLLLTSVCNEVGAGGVEDTAPEYTVEDSEANGSPGEQRIENSDVVNIDEGADGNECTVKDVETNASPGGKRNENSDTVNIDGGVDANECTVKEDETNGSPGENRNENSDVVNIDEGVDANEYTVKDNKTNGSSGENRNENSDVVNIDKGVDNNSECTVKEGETNAIPDGKVDADSCAKESTVKGSKKSASPGRKRGVSFNLVNIDSAGETAVNGSKISVEESTAGGSKTRATDARKREATSELVNIGSADERAAKRSKTASGKEDAVCELVEIDDTECTVKHSSTTVGKKRDSVSDLVNTGVTGGSANECPVNLSKVTPNTESERETGTALVNIDDNEDNANEKDVLGKRNATVTRKRDAASDIVNIDDTEDSSNGPKDVLGKTDGTACRKSGTDTDVVNVDDVEDGAVELGGGLESANRTGRKESLTVSDVIDVEEVDSDVEVIETEGLSVPDVVVVAEQYRKKVKENFSPETPKRKRSRASGVAKSFVRRSLRYAVLVFNRKDVVDTIQATRPHILESGVQLVTFRGSSPDVDSSLNTRLNKRVIVKVPRNYTILTTEEVQRYFSQYGQIYDTEKVTLTGMESGSATFVVGFEDYDSADVACLNSPHFIKGVNVTCEKVEDDDLLLSGTKMDPICIENDSDVEEVQVEVVKTEPSTSQQSQEGKGPDEVSTSGGQSGGLKRPSDEMSVTKRKRFRRRKNFESNDRTPQNTTAADPVAVADGRFAVPAVPGGSGHGGQSVTHPWNARGGPPNAQLPQRPVQAATPAPSAAGGVRPAAAGATPADRSAQTFAKVGAPPAAAVRQFGNFRKPAADVRTYVTQAQGQMQTQGQTQMQRQMQVQTPRPTFQQAPTTQWRRPQPLHLQPRWAYSWTPAKREPPPPARPTAPPPMRPLVPHRVLTGVPITRASFSSPSHVTRTRPAPPAPGSANARTFIPRATGSQGPRF